MGGTNKSTVEERKKTAWADWGYRLLPVLSILLLILSWHLASSNSPDSFPTIQATWERFLLLWEKPIMRVSYPGHILASLKRVCIALFFSWLIGISFGIIIGWNRKMDAFFGTIFAFIRPIPPIAWIPLITIWFGIDEFPKILIVFIGAVMPVVINTHAGLSSVEQLYLNVGTAFNANRFQMLFEVAIPSALPSIFAGIRTSTSTAWMVVLAAEMLGAKSGVGFLVVRGMDGLDMPLVLVAMITIGVIGALLAAVTNFIERRLCPWMSIR